MTFSIVHALLGLEQGAPLPPPEPLPEPPPAPPEPAIDPAEVWHVEGAYHPQDHGTTPGGEHIVMSRALISGRLRRAAGDPLCRPARTFWGLTGRRPAGNRAACKRCLELARRHGFDLADPTAAPTPPRGRVRKRIADGGVTPHRDTCGCGIAIIRHWLPGRVPVVLDAAPLEEGTQGQRFAILFGTAVPDPDPRNLPAGEPLYRAHVCPPRCAICQRGTDCDVRCARCQRYAYLVGSPCRSTEEEAEVLTLRAWLQGLGCDPGWEPTSQGAWRDDDETPIP